MQNLNYPFQATSPDSNYLFPLQFPPEFIDNTISSSQSMEDDFYYNETVDVIDTKTLTIQNGKIISIRGSKIIVQLPSGEEKLLDRLDGQILRQWDIGRPFQFLNRVDLLLPNHNNYWTEGIIIGIDNDNKKVQIRYKNKKGDIVDEWIHQESERISKVGSHCGKFDPNNCDSDTINKRLYAKRKFFQLNSIQEKKLRNGMYKVNMCIKEVKGDGNCMFRAISDQVYGDEIYHEIIRDKCMDYIEMEKDFFSQFIEGGEDSFEEYVQMKRTLGVWGDDIELQAISEMYNRPIEIYSNAVKPLKTFHEDENFQRGMHEDKNGELLVKKKLPIKVSYHGKAHYNSIVPNKMNAQYNLFVNNLIKKTPGEVEDKLIAQVRKRNEQKQIKNEMNVNNKEPIIKEENVEETVVKNDNEINKAREMFIEKKSKHLDEILEETVSSATNNEDDENVNQILMQSELEKHEEDFLNSAIKLSLEQQQPNNDTNTNTNQNQSQQLNNNEIDYYSIPSIQTALEFGFSLEDAILAYSLYGDSSDLMLQYLYSLNLSHFNN